MTAEPKKRGLGRGLDALFQDARKEEEAFQPKIKRADEMVAAIQAQQANHAGGSPRHLPVDRLTPGKFQPRRHFDDGALDQLADSISAHGVLQPLLVRPLTNMSGGSTMYEIIAGERRWRAAQKAQVHEVPVVIQELSDRDALEIALIENLQREDLTAVEEAEGYQWLVDEFGHTQDVLAQQLGKSRSHVANTLRLLKLPATVRAMIQNGALSAGHARALVGAKNPDELADVIMRRGLNVRQVEALVQKTSEGKLKPRKQKGVVQKDVDVLALEELTSGKLGLRVTIDSHGQAGRLSIEYKTLDQLDDLLTRLGQTPRK